MQRTTSPEKINIKAFYDENFERLNKDLSSENEFKKFTAACELLLCKDDFLKEYENAEDRKTYIAKQYRNRQFIFHPDKHPDNVDVANKISHLIGRAKEILEQEIKREILSKQTYKAKHKYELPSYEKNTAFYIRMATTSNEYYLYQYWGFDVSNSDHMNISSKEPSTNQQLMSYDGKRREVAFPGYQAFCHLYLAGATPSGFGLPDIFDLKQKGFSEPITVSNHLKPLTELVLTTPPPHL